MGNQPITKPQLWVGIGSTTDKNRDRIFLSVVVPIPKSRSVWYEHRFFLSSDHKNNISTAEKYK